MSFAFRPSTSTGKYLFVNVEMPVCVQLLEDLGQIEAVGKGAKNDKGDQRFWEAFKVQYEGNDKLLVGGWRLRVALQEGLKEVQDAQPWCKITAAHEMEKIKTGAMVVVKKYVVVPLNPADVPF